MAYRIGTLVRLKNTKTLHELGKTKDMIKGSVPECYYYGSRYAIIINENKEDYELYFPFNDNTSAWFRDCQFDVIKDLVCDYRGDYVKEEE